MSGVNIPTDSSHLSDFDRSEMIEQYGGEVQKQFNYSSVLRQFFNVHRIVGTDTKIIRRMGATELGKVTPGVRPAATSVHFGRTSLTVDTLVYARENRDLLNEFQTDFAARQMLGYNHGVQIAKLFDQSFLIQMIKASYLPVPTAANGESYNGAFGAGRNLELGATGDDLDADALYNAIEAMVTEMEEDDVPLEGARIFIRPTHYNVLLHNDKLVSGDYSPSNGDVSKMRINYCANLPLFKTNRIPKAAITGHLLSNAGNGNAYDVTAQEADTVAIVAQPETLLAGETIPLVSNVFYSDVEKQWFIDSHLAFGVTPNRGDVTGCIYKKQA